MGKKETIAFCIVVFIISLAIGYAIFEHANRQQLNTLRWFMALPVPIFGLAMIMRVMIEYLEKKP